MSTIAHPRAGGPVGRSDTMDRPPVDAVSDLRDLCGDPETAYGVDGNDQRYITGVAMNRHYWPDGWCASFRRTGPWPRPFNFLFKVRGPRNTKIVVFHGKPRPLDLVLEGDRRWGTKWKFGFGPVGWVKDYWERGLGGV